MLLVTPEADLGLIDIQRGVENMPRLKRCRFAVIGQLLDPLRIYQVGKAGSGLHDTAHSFTDADCGGQLLLADIVDLVVRP